MTLCLLHWRSPHSSSERAPRWWRGSRLSSWERISCASVLHCDATRTRYCASPTKRRHKSSLHLARGLLLYPRDSLPPLHEVRLPLCSALFRPRLWSRGSCGQWGEWAAPEWSLSRSVFLKFPRTGTVLSEASLVYHWRLLSPLASGSRCRHGGRWTGRRCVHTELHLQLL